MSETATTDRFSVTMKIKEIAEIKEFNDATGVPRNELMRRAALAYIRYKQGKGTDIEKLFREVGSVDQAEVQSL